MTLTELSFRDQLLAFVTFANFPVECVLITMVWRANRQNNVKESVLHTELMLPKILYSAKN